MGDDDGAAFVWVGSKVKLATQTVTNQGAGVSTSWLHSKNKKTSFENPTEISNF